MCRRVIPIPLLLPPSASSLLAPREGVGCVITDPDSWDAVPAEVLAGVEAILGVPAGSVLQRI